MGVTGVTGVEPASTGSRGCFSLERRACAPALPLLLSPGAGVSTTVASAASATGVTGVTGVAASGKLEDGACAYTKVRPFAAREATMRYAIMRHKK